jgi:glyoxylase-like metal-dependent hydrolase (beta-lactamase superfamily II)
MRSRLLLTVCLLWLVGMGCATGRGLPPRPAVVGPDGIRGYRSVHALFYVVPLPDSDGVVLVDAGFENDGATVLRAVGRRRVEGILLTHSHADHWAGAHVFKDVPVYVGRADVGRILGSPPNRAPLAWVGERALVLPPVPRNLVPVDDGTPVCFRGTCFTAVSMPGHTPGSTAWLAPGGLLFLGDAAMHEDDPAVLLAVVGEDSAAARRSAARLATLPVTVILDGHDGMTRVQR